jgi:hypothetical protein
LIRPGALALVLMLAATTAGAQDAPVTTAPDPLADAIGDVLADPEAYATDVEEPDLPPLGEVPPKGGKGGKGATAPESAGVSPLSLFGTAPPGGEQPRPVAVAPQPMTLPPLPPQIVTRPKLERPVNINETGLTPEGPLAPQELGYDMRVRANIASAQGRQGQLDGGWTVAGSDGTKLYSLQLVDPGDSITSLEGAWRSLQRQGLGTTGLITGFERGATSLVVRFNRRSADNPTVLTLQPTIDGSWTGEMWEDGQTRPVTMRRG